MSYASLQAKALEILDPAYHKGIFVSKACDTFIAFLVVANILAVTLESVSDFSLKYGDYFYYFEFFSVIFFSVEYLLRLWCSAARTGESEKIFGRTDDAVG